MAALDDNTLLTIFKQLRLDQRASLRLANRRFKLLCNSIEINKLVIYHRGEPKPGRLKFNLPSYGLQDTVYVYDLQKFFENEQIVRRQMRRIETLVVQGDTYACSSPIKIGHRFEQLNYLELAHVEIVTSEILKSKQIKYLALLDRSCLIRQNCSLGSPAFEVLGLASLASKVKCFSSDLQVDSTFVSRCVQSGLFDSLEQLELNAENLTDLPYLSERCRSLRVLRWSNACLSTVLPCLTESGLAAIVKRLRADLCVYIFGVPLNQQTASFTPAFFRQLSGCLQTSEDGLAITINPQIYKFLNSSIEKHHQLSGFFSQIGNIYLAGEIPMNRQLFRHFRDCSSLYFGGSSDVLQFLDAFTRLKSIHLGPTHAYGNDLLFSIAKKACDLEELKFVHLSESRICEQRLDFGFLFGLRGLRRLTALLRNPIATDTFIGLIKELKHLVLLDVRFLRSNGEPSRERLSEFKKEVNRVLEKKRKGVVFKIEIHSKDGYQFIRYLFATKCNVREMFEIERSMYFQYAQFIQQLS